ncbi:MAG: transposase [Candidatus Binatia bacterium]
MISGDSILVSLVHLVDALPFPPPPAQRKRGRPQTYSDQLLVKALIVMIIGRLYTAWALLAFLQQDDPLVTQLRPLLTENGECPTRRTWERRLAALPPTLPGLIGRLGRHLVTLLTPWTQQGHGAACDSTAIRAHGGVWHEKDREAGLVPHSSIDTEAHWRKSGWHGWWYGWKLHLAVSIGSVWLPLAAEFTVANVADSEIAPLLFTQLPAEVRYVLGDQHYNTPELRTEGGRHNRELGATHRGAYPHTDDGVEVRRIFHKLRSQAIEPFNGLFKNLFAWGGQMPVKGLRRCQLLALGAVLLYQVVLLYQHQHQHSVGVGIKALLRAA